MGDLNYSLVVESRGSQNRPSRNTPLVCPECPQEPSKTIVWMYNMRDHWKRLHAGVEMPSNVKAQVEINDNERSGVLRFKNTKKKRPGRQKQSGQRLKKRRTAHVTPTKGMEAIDDASHEGMEELGSEIQRITDENSMCENSNADLKDSEEDNSGLGEESNFDDVIPHAV